MTATAQRPLHAAPPFDDASRTIREALEYLCVTEHSLAQMLNVADDALTEVRDGTRTLSLPQTLAVVRRLREQAALLQLAAEAAAEAVQSDVARLACDAFDDAMREPDRERAVECALQVLFDLSA